MKAFAVAILVFCIVGVAALYHYKIVRPQGDPNRIRVFGNVEVIDAQVGFKIPGRVEDRPVDEGQMVRKGQLVARLDDADLKSDVALREAELRAAQAMLAELEAGSRPEEIAASLALQEKAAAALAELKAGTRPQEIAVAEAALQSAQVDRVRLEAEFGRSQKLREKGMISSESFDQAKAAFDVAASKVQEATLRLDLAREGPRKEQILQAQAALAQAQAQYALVKAGPREETKQQSRAKVEQAKAALQLARTRLDYATLSAPWEGLVLSKNIEPGEYVSPGTPVITIGNLKSVWVRAYISEQDLGRVKVGQKARVTTDTYPGKEYPGVVSFISSEAEFTPKSVQTQQERVKLVYRIKVDIDNPAMELKPGMPADAEIILDTP